MNDIDEQEFDYGPSKSELKREQNAIEELGKAIVALGPTQIQALPLSEAFLNEIVMAQKLQRTALKRQYKHIRKMLANEDLEAIRKKLQVYKDGAMQENVQFQRLEAWREALLADDSSVREKIAAAIPDIDWQYLNQLIRNAKKEKQLNKPAKSYRLIFTYLRDL